MRHDPRIALTVELGIQGDQLVRRHWSANLQGVSSSDRIQDIVAEAPDGTPISLAMLLDWLAPRQHTRESVKLLDKQLGGPGLDAAGTVLFFVLFGTNVTQAMNILNTVYPTRNQERDPTPLQTPIFAPIRVRVQPGAGPDSQRLLGLPWMATQWNSHLLIDHGWTFEERVPGVIDLPLRLQIPPRMLFLAPEMEREGAEEPGIQTKGHLLDIREIWESVWAGWEERPGHFEVVTTIAAAREAAKRSCPEVVYYYGHGSVDGGQSYLVFPADREPRILARDLLKQILPADAEPPSIVFLNACSVGRAGWHSAGYQLGTSIPLVLSNLSPVHGRPARALGRRFWKAVLWQEMDPIVALHDRRCGEHDSLGLRASSRDFRELAALVVTARYQSAVLHHAPGVTGQEPLRQAFDLDRIKQRAHLRHEIEETLDSKLRVHVVIAHGSRGNLMVKAPEQLTEYLQSKMGSRVQLRKVKLLPPAAGVLDRLAFKSMILELAAVRARQGRITHLAGAFQALAPAKLGGAQPVVWFDTGHLMADSEASLPSIEAQIDELCSFFSDAAEYTGDLLVVASVALETSATTADAMAKHLEEVAGDAGLRTTMRVTVLDPFKEPPLNEVMTYLETNRCAPDIVQPLARALLKSPGGTYETLVRCLDEVRTPADYRALLRKLSPAAAKRGTP